MPIRGNTSNRDCPRCGHTISSAWDNQVGWCKHCQDWTLPDIEGSGGEGK